MPGHLCRVVVTAQPHRRAQRGPGLQERANVPDAGGLQLRHLPLDLQSAARERLAQEAQAERPPDGRSRHSGPGIVIIHVHMALFTLQLLLPPARQPAVPCCTVRD
mmetsp:Transcript_258/g.836  ORF Transcript_258/g.836 Transcript_258/m.836 type:complete len:106 (+) Transcript_258:1464-1781(+)